ncbi:hypothetical protein SteCoe_18031 [Stentor coeruleus]|uniref:Rubisco LSMT substrate-binding domain-containing protein n=1 Tax=Stentor coeruleus TaxID=5963 RepID=A0A1R2BXH5_9CILI|nr:hypothetical protein SteCoe_18031 [Stentor coeruleus]
MDSTEKDQKTQTVGLLKNWLESLGCEISPKVEYPALFNNQLYGMIAKSEIGPKETLIRIKHDAIISTELLQNTELQVIFDAFPEFFSKANPEGIDNQFLSLIIYEKSKGPTSKWALFFNTLPQTIDNLCDWDPNEVDELQDIDLKSDYLLRKDKNIGSYHDLRRILNKYPEIFPNEISVYTIEWCWKIIWTRSFMRSPEHSALIPYADFINHGPSNTGFYFADQKEEEVDEEIYYTEYDEMYTTDDILKISCRDLYEINFSAIENVDDNIFELAKRILVEADVIEKSLKDKKTKKSQGCDDINNSDLLIVTGDTETYAEGSQIIFEYGNYSNTSLLIHYGFIIPDNRFEYFRLKISLSKLLQPLQLKHLPHKYKKASFLIFYFGLNELSRDFLRTIRALLWTPNNRNTSFFSQSDLSLEKKVLLKYAEILNNSLKSYPSTIEQDQNLNPSSYRHNSALAYRIQKKQILKKQAQISISALKIIDKIQNKNPLSQEEQEICNKELKSYIDCVQYYYAKDQIPSQIMFNSS